jgi:chitin synthase
MSSMFYKTPFWNQYCPTIPQPQNQWDNIKREIPENAKRIWYPHQGSNNGMPVNYLQKISKMRRGTMARDRKWIMNTLAADVANNKIITAYKRVYDVTMYLDGTNTNEFLGKDFRAIFQTLGSSGQDGTPFFEDLRATYPKKTFNALYQCMDNLFFVGVVDERNSLRCVISNYILLGSSILVVVVIGFKFFAALQTLGSRRFPAEFHRHTIIQIPCYTEGATSLSKTIDSVVDTIYDDDFKFMFIVCDGLITGSGNDRTTPEIVLELLGADPNENVEPVIYHSIGEPLKQLNYARVYSGRYRKQGRKVPYVVIVKVGIEGEDIKIGNRGKRDSQMILMRFLSRVHFQSAMTPLELEIYRQMEINLKMPPSQYEFVLMVDADTEVLPDGLNRMISAMIRDSKISGLCGETLIANEMESWVTMIQIYEYFISHHMAKAFESLFGAVTCLPGCFCMYRIRTVTKNLPVFVSPKIIKDYEELEVDTLHKKVGCLLIND